jgi:hypothetical protein
MVFQAYVDNSYDHHVHVLAGYIATADAWIEFSDDWQKGLDDAGLHAFKMNEIAREENCNRICETFYHIIEKHVSTSLSCVVSIDALVDAVRGLSWPIGVFDGEKLANPYSFPFYQIINFLIDNQESMGIADPVDFIFDNQTEKIIVLEGWDLFRASAPPTVHKMLGAMPRFEDDEQFLPLQAADMLAWWCRKRENEFAFDSVDRTVKFPWKTTKNMHHLRISFFEHEIREYFDALLGNARGLWLAQQPKEFLRQIDDAQTFLNSAVEDDRPSLLTRLWRWLMRSQS